MWSSMLEKNLGVIWVCNKNGTKCVWNGVFSCKESLCLATIFAKSTWNVWNGEFMSNSIHRKTMWSAQNCVEWGVNPRWKSTRYGSFRIFIFEHATTLFGWDAPLSICYKLLEKLFIFTVNIPAKFKIPWGLIFGGKRHARPTGAYFQRGLIFEGGLLFRVYSMFSNSGTMPSGTLSFIIYPHLLE